MKHMTKPRTRRQRANAFYRWCEDHDACNPGLEWIKGKTYREVWDTLTNPCWLLWLAVEIHSFTGPAKTRIEREFACRRAGGQVRKNLTYASIQRLDGRYVRAERANHYPNVTKKLRAKIRRPHLAGM